MAFLCKDIQQINTEEKKCVAQAIGYLGPPNEEVISVIFKLLEDENEVVKKEAGKALSMLNS